MKNKALLQKLLIFFSVINWSACSPPVTIPLSKSSVVTGSIRYGETSSYYFNSLESLNPLLSYASTPKSFNLYLTLSVCSLPPHSKQIEPLDLFISQNNLDPGLHTKEGGNEELRIRKELGLEYVRMVVQDISSSEPFYIAVHAPKLDIAVGEEDTWEYELSISTTGFMEKEENPTLVFHDADHSTATFSISPYIMRESVFKVHILPDEENLNWMPSCMLAKKSLQSLHVKRDLSEESLRFYVDDLNVDSKYRIFYTEELTGHNRHKRVTRGVPFGTAQAKSNCKTIQPTKFCKMVNYAVPSPNNNTNQTTLANMYDQLAMDRYQQFATALKRFDCSTIYSPLRKCEDCQKAYANWICATSIPRCTIATPSGVEAPGLQFRNGDPSYQVGPFTLNITNAFVEYLPCVDICWEVVRSCPAFFQFSCPDSNPSDYGTAPNCNNITSFLSSRGSRLGISLSCLYMTFLTYFVNSNR